MCIIDPPVIDKGSFVPRPSVITRGNKKVKIGTPVYVHSGFDVIIDCNIVNGTPPINITWFRNGSPYPTRGSVSTITITDANNGDVFKCRADNIIGFDTESTTIHVEYGKCIYVITIVIDLFSLVCVRVCVCVFVLPYTLKHSRGKTFAVHEQYALCRENFSGLQT